MDKKYLKDTISILNYDEHEGGKKMALQIMSFA